MFGAGKTESGYELYPRWFVFLFGGDFNQVLYDLKKRKWIRRNVGYG